MLPQEFVEYYKKLCLLEYDEKPDYDGLKTCIKNAWERICDTEHVVPKPAINNVLKSSLVSSDSDIS